MPFIALSKETRKRIDITTFEHPRQELNNGAFICPFCNTPMIIKAGMIKQPHFAHINTCTSPYGSHPESPEHREGKAFLKRNLPLRYPEYKDARFEYEWPIKEVSRIVDLLAIFPNGHRVAHEVQLASITTETLEKRTNDYRRAGIDVIWWLGKAANTNANRDWCARTFGEVCSISFYV
jgi:competence protein CoiA